MAVTDLEASPGHNVQSRERDCDDFEEEHSGGIVAADGVVVFLLLRERQVGYPEGTYSESRSHPKTNGRNGEHEFHPFRKPASKYRPRDRLVDSVEKIPPGFISVAVDLAASTGDVAIAASAVAVARRCSTCRHCRCC